jgi:hypothetical protein
VVKRHSRNINVISPKIGLHPLVRAYTDILAMARLQPKEISRKIQADFAMDPMFLQSLPVRDIVTEQTSHRIRLIHHDGIQKQPNQKNISIQFTLMLSVLKKNYFFYQLASNLASLNQKPIYWNLDVP